MDEKLRDDRDEVETSLSPSATRRAIASAGRLRWFHWMLVAFSLALTVGASYVTKAEIDAKVEARFDRQSDQAVSLVVERLAKYEDGLWGGVAAIQSNGGDISHSEWRTFADSLDIEDRYPGINGIGVIHAIEPSDFGEYFTAQMESRPDYRVHPIHDESLFLPISYIEPSGPNAAAIGLDMAHEANRYDGIKRAREFGAAQMTGPIVLVQDAESTPGFLFYAPWYHDGDPIDVETRRERFAGAVYAPFVVTKLMDGALDESNRQVGISITDGDVVLYDEHNESVPDFDADPLFREQVRIPLYGRQWTFDIWSARSFRDSSSNSEPLLILLGGLGLDAMLFALFATLSRANRRALRYADEVSAELREYSAKLEVSNADLERFAYVASHDLKTPLRGIGDLTEYLEEDLAEYMSSESANPDVRVNLGRVTQQTERMNALISGILDYSREGFTPPSAPELFSVSFVLDRMRSDLDLRDEQLIHRGADLLTLPAVVSFEQVLQNLVSNAVNHHHDKGNAQIEVSVDVDGDRIAVNVRDNGPGIDSRHHERIFGVFQRLDVQAEGTGVGLSIVKRIVESHGGRVQVDSAEGQGALFRFDWPHVDRSEVSEFAAATEDSPAIDGVPAFEGSRGHG